MVGEVLPMCQIEGKHIAPEHCEQLQKTCNGDDCFGCGSQYRLCAVCRNNTVFFPEVQFCHTCLQTALQQEQMQTPVQGQGREKCIRCQLRVIQYPQYNFCLCCTVSEYAPQPTTSSRLTLPQIEIIHKENDMSRDGPDDLYGRAVEFTNTKKELTAQDLVAAMSIELPMARKLMQKMEQEKVVGPHRGRWPRHVLKNNDQAAISGNNSPAHALSRILAPTSLGSKAVNQEISSLSPVDRQLVGLGLAFLQQHLEELVDKLKQ
jgi:hypothetical protein